jgi:branched-chain amino acid transport system permease protein
MQDLLSIFSFILVNGVSYGVILFTMSIGLVIMLGLMHVVNLAHGAFAAIGGYVTVTLMNAHGVPFLAAVAGSVVAVAALSLIVERLFYVHLYDSSELEQVLLTIGLVFALARVPRAGSESRIAQGPGLPPLCGVRRRAADARALVALRAN